MRETTTRVRRWVTARPWVTAGVVVVLAAAGVGGWFAAGSSSSPAAGATVTTRTVAVSTGTVQESVSTTGTFAPADEEDVSFSSAAEITSVDVAVGDKVTKGQVLGTIDTLSLKATLAQDEASLADARAQLDSAEDDDSATDAQLAADKSSVTTAEATVISDRQNLDDATLVSPIAGTVAEVNVTKGDQSSGGSGSSSGSSSAGGTTGAGSATSSSTSSSGSGDFVVLGGKSWTVSASVDDTEVGEIAKGDQVQITTDNVSGTVFGTVSSVSVLSSGSSGSASYPVTIAVTGSPSGLHDGASATASIIYKKVTNVLTVPTLAIHSDGSTSYVLVSANGKQTKTTVTTGLAAGGTTQIKSGLTEGQEVVEQVVTRAPTTGSSTSRQEGTFPSGGFGGEGGFPGGGTGNFPGAGTGGGTGNFGGFGGGR